MKWKAFLIITIAPLLIGIFSVISLPTYSNNALAQQDSTPMIVTVEVPVTVEVTRIVTVVVTPTFTPLPPTPTPLPPELTLDDDPFLGSADAPIKIVEFSDFQCGFCARFASETLTPLLDHYGDLVQFVYRDYPIFGDPSVFAALGAECVADQSADAFWMFHNELFDNHIREDRQELNVPFMQSLVIDLELDVEAWNTCLESEATFTEIVNDYQTGYDWNITGTPTFFINGEKLVGAQTLETFMAIIDQKLIELGYEPPEH